MKSLRQLQKGFGLEDGILAIVREIRREAEQSDSPVIIKVAGGSGAGKSTIAERLNVEFSGDVLIISEDDYRKGMKFASDHGINLDQPEIVDSLLLLEHLRMLRNGQSIKKPIFCFSDPEPCGFEIVDSRKIIIVEGLFVLGDVLDEIGNMSIYIDSTERERFRRRVKRDIKRIPTWTIDRIVDYFVDVALPMHDKYIEPQRSKADVVISN